MVPSIENVAHGTATPASSAPLPPMRSLEPSAHKAVPANLEVAGPLREAVERMWQRSPTFRRQCARLARASLLVTIRMRPLESQRPRGLSRVEREAGRLKHAHVYIGYGPLVVETIAHELEHVVEQLDGVDLALQVERGAARRSSSYHYETFRAMEVGQRVAREVRHRPERQSHKTEVPER